MAYINGSDRKATTAARNNRKDNIRIATENRIMDDAANAAMQEWAKTLSPELQQELVGKRRRRLW